MLRGKKYIIKIDYSLLLVFYSYSIILLHFLLLEGEGLVSFSIVYLYWKPPAYYISILSFIICRWPLRYTETRPNPSVSTYQFYIVIAVLGRGPKGTKRI